VYNFDVYTAIESTELLDNPRIYLTLRPMQLNTVIFDMDGLLIDSEPFWQEAGMETLEQFDIALTLDQYHHTTGLRTKEWIDYWFGYFHINKNFAREAEEIIHRKAIEKIGAKGEAMPGVDHILAYFKKQDFRIGVATSSPMALVDVVIDKLGIRDYLDAIASAGDLPFGKPHPQVYMNCAVELAVSPLHCICFEDSFNGLIAAKAARMKCVVIPLADQYALPKWGAADLKLHGLPDFNAAHLDTLSQ
jgi:mannitol-1-/sugar-/sorbitol-6-/2-deoxyglucose-6-phosphatase